MQDKEETCIVCLGDLGVAGCESPSKSPTAKDDASVVGADPGLIANLLPCGHHLHDECLRPWVERANSCPICRQKFNEVQVSKRIGDPIINSYAVSDKEQVADIDPSMLIEEDEFDSQPCPICGNDDNEDLLLLCDGCAGAYHTYCVDLDTVPAGHWFCEECQVQQAIEMTSTSNPPLNHHHHSSSQRTRAQRQRARAHARPAPWERVWQSVWDHLNLDLNYPHDDEHGEPEIGSARSLNWGRGRYANPAQVSRAWQRRLQVAERQGSHRFRDTAPALLERAPAPQPPKESLDEVMAWNALEKAKDMNAETTPTRSRKRKSTTASPSESDGRASRKRRRSATSSPSENRPTTQPERRLKRPQTRRLRENGEGSSTQRQATGNGVATSSEQGPSFLQLLLREVETSRQSEDARSPTQPGTSISGVTSTDHNSPHNSSPGGSPRPSISRALSITPPPVPSLNTGRPGSPVLLSSSIEPLYPSVSYSPDSSPIAKSPTTQQVNGSNISSSRASALKKHKTKASVDLEISPSRVNLSLSAKEAISGMVKDALRPQRRAKRLSDDQYTDLNRNISRKLYDLIGTSEGTIDEQMAAWRERADEEVTKALGELPPPNETWS